jgi:hypothetical protein
LPASHEVLRGGTVQKIKQFVVVAGHIKQAYGFVVVAKLAPGPDFKQFLEGADAAG